MRILLLQFVDPTRMPAQPVFSHELGTLAAMLKAAGNGQGLGQPQGSGQAQGLGQRNEVSLAAMGGYQPAALREAVIRHRPQWVVAELGPCSITAARRSIAELNERFGLGVVAVGEYATCAAENVISWPGVTAVVVGEYDVAAAELLACLRDGDDAETIPGVWLRTPQGVAKGPPAALTADLDSLPPPDRSIFGPPAAWGPLPVRITRGCGRWCGFCTNDLYMDLYDGQPYCRRRSVSNVLAELAGSAANCREIAFADHGFASEPAWLDEFAAAYPKACGLPYRCHIRPMDASPEAVAALAASGCRGATLEVGCGSRFIREEILAIEASDEQIVAAARSLSAAGIEVTARVFIGCPYESEITLEETLALLRACRPAAVSPRVFYPRPGTRAHELCRENGWISGRGEENYWLGRSVLDMPSLPARLIDAAAANLPSLLKNRSGTPIRTMLDKVARPVGLLGFFGRR